MRKYIIKQVMVVTNSYEVYADSYKDAIDEFKLSPGNQEYIGQDNYGDAKDIGTLIVEDHGEVIHE